MSNICWLLPFLLFPLYKETIRTWEANLAQSIPQSGTQDVTLEPEDFVVSVSF